MDTSMDITEYMQDVGTRARVASRAMARADSATRNRALTLIAAAIVRDADLLRAANQRDLDAAAAAGLAPAMLDRLTLSDAAIATMVEGLTQIVALADPIGEISNMKFRPTGIQVGQMRVPLGVIGIIYEARPNVTADAAALCLKSGNAAILRGGKEALHSNQAIAACVRAGLAAAGLPELAIQVVEITDRAHDYAQEVVDRLRDLLEEVARDEDGLALAREVLEEAAQDYRICWQQSGEARHGLSLATILHDLGQFDEALQCYDEVLATMAADDPRRELVLERRSRSENNGAGEREQSPVAPAQRGQPANVSEPGRPCLYGSGCRASSVGNGFQHPRRAGGGVAGGMSGCRSA